MHSSGPSKFVVAVLFSWEAFYQGNVFRIYHNIRYQHRLRPLRAFLTGKPAKQATNRRKPAETRRLCFTACMVCAQVHSAEIHAIQPGVSPVSGVLPIRKRWTGTQFIAWPWSVAGTAGKPVFSTFRDPSTAGNHVMAKIAGRLTTRFTRFDSWLDSRVTTVIKTKRRFDSRVKSS